MSTILLAFSAIIVLSVAGLVLFTAIIARRVEKALPPRGQFLEVDGARLHYLDIGQGPPIVMIHGLGGQIAHYAYGLAERLEDDFRLIVIDRPGSGYSGRACGASARLRAQGDVIAKAIKALKLEKPLIVGHSMGGAVALAIGLDHPESVGGLALLAPLTHPVETPPEMFAPLLIGSKTLRWLIALTVATPMAIRRGATALAEVFSPDPIPADFPLKGGGLLGLRPSAFQAASLDLVSSNADLWKMVKRYPTLAMPLSILYGTEDRVLDYRAHGVAMKDLVPATDLLLVPGGHMPQFAIPDKTADFIRKAAKKLDRAGATQRVAEATPPRI